jgi:hypothetical protein
MLQLPPELKPSSITATGIKIRVTISTSHVIKFSIDLRSACHPLRLIVILLTLFNEKKHRHGKKMEARFNPRTAASTQR